MRHIETHKRMARNVKRMRGKLTRNAPLLQDLGYLADGPAIEDILNDVYIPPDGTD
jgi:hypothetical protein